MAAGAAHAAADLVQLGEAEAVGVLDDEGVDVRDVDAGLDDGGADEDLDLTVRHRLHDVAELLLIHLAVGDGDLRLRDALLDLRGALVDRLDPVVQVIDLPAARKLAPHGLVQNAVLMLEDEGLHGIAVLRRLLDGGHVAKAGQGHIERARDGRCG